VRAEGLLFFDESHHSDFEIAEVRLRPSNAPFRAIEGVCDMAKPSKKKVRNQPKPSEDAVLRRKLKTEPKPQKGKKGKTASQGAH
jgi:hypothetical protein